MSTPVQFRTFDLVLVTCCSCVYCVVVVVVVVVVV